jgi:DNA-binding transcriptional regulator YiaG
MTAAELRRLIATTGMTNPEFAERLGITRQTAWMWATGRTPISRQAAALIKTTIGTGQ